MGVRFNVRLALPTPLFLAQVSPFSFSARPGGCQKGPLLPHRESGWQLGTIGGEEGDFTLLFQLGATKALSWAWDLYCHLGGCWFSLSDSGGWVLYFLDNFGVWMCGDFWPGIASAGLLGTAVAVRPCRWAGRWIYRRSRTVAAGVGRGSRGAPPCAQNTCAV